MERKRQETSRARERTRTKKVPESVFKTFRKKEKKEKKERYESKVYRYPEKK